MERKGKKLKTLAPGDRRRISDGKNAVRKMTAEQRTEFIEWMDTEFGFQLVKPRKLVKQTAN